MSVPTKTILQHIRKDDMNHISILFANMHSSMFFMFSYWELKLLPSSTFTRAAGLLWEAELWKANQHKSWPKVPSGTTDTFSSVFHILINSFGNAIDITYFRICWRSWLRTLQWVYEFFSFNEGKSTSYKLQLPHRIRHELSSSARMLVSWIELPLEACMSMCLSLLCCPLYR
jgi:hypothetical protein